jgi:type II secretory pathway predicted ATPase ExeA
MLDFHRLREQPFSLLPNPRFMVLSQPYQETKVKLLYFLKDRIASLYLYGPVRSGKTSLLRLIALKEFDSAARPLYNRSALRESKCEQILVR